MKSQAVEPVTPLYQVYSVVPAQVKVEIRKAGISFSTCLLKAGRTGRNVNLSHNPFLNENILVWEVGL